MPIFNTPSLEFPLAGRRACAAMLLVCGVLLILSLFWSREPEPFEVFEGSPDRTAGSDKSGDDVPLPQGHTTVSTLVRLVETLLGKPGGYLSNDRMPPGIWLDNIPAWEYGVLTQVRDFTNALRNDFSRAHSQSRDRPELREAETRFAFAHDAWILPSAEKEYRRGIELLNTYVQALGENNNTQSDFVVRPDNLDGWLRRAELRLGACTLQLRANAGVEKYDSNVLTSGQELDGISTGEAVPWRDIDNVFFQARGTAWAMYHLLKAIKQDYQPVLDNRLAMGALNRSLSNLHAALQPVRSPLVLNGRDFGPTPNHSLVLAAYLANAHLAISDLRTLLINN